MPLILNLLPARFLLTLREWFDFKIWHCVLNSLRKSCLLQHSTSCCPVLLICFVIKSLCFYLKFLDGMVQLASTGALYITLWHLWSAEQANFRFSFKQLSLTVHCSVTSTIVAMEHCTTQLVKLTQLNETCMACWSAPTSWDTLVLLKRFPNLN